MPHRMTKNTKLAIWMTLGIIVAMSIAVIVTMMQNSQTREDRAAELQRNEIATVRDDSHRLDDVSDAEVTVVEFLDFECEYCAAAYPMVEAAREEFAGQVTFVVRYFPLPGHSNSATSAFAVEAAAQQGAFEEMYSRMFETQAQWGEQQESQAPLFREYAEELGLDMAQYDADVADPATAERVASDFDDGRVLGVSGTPTFFVNDQPVELATVDSLRDAIAGELEK